MVSGSLLASGAPGENEEIGNGWKNIVNHKSLKYILLIKHMINDRHSALLSFALFVDLCNVLAATISAVVCIQA